MNQPTDLLRASVIIPAYNAELTIGRCLDALIRQSIPPESYEIIVIDDASSDSTTSVASTYAVRVIGQTHAGPAAARNLGAQVARGPILLFTDADCVPTPDWIEAMLRPFDNPQVVGVKGAYRTNQRALVARFVQLEFTEKYRRMAKREFVDFIDTYSAAYRRSVFIDNGGFDTLFTVPSAEDQELAFRLAEQGCKLAFAPDAIVYHTHPDTWQWYFNRKVRFGFWQTINRWKHPKKILRDSYTPESQKIQLALVALLLPVTLAAFFDARWWLGDVALIVAFKLSLLPFVRLTLELDPPVVPIAPAMLALRAVGVLAGLAAGSVSFTYKWLTQRRMAGTQTLPK